MLGFRRYRCSTRCIVGALCAFLIVSLFLRTYVNSRFGFNFKNPKQTIPPNSKTIAMGSPLFGDRVNRASNILETVHGHTCQFVQDIAESDAAVYHCADQLSWRFTSRYDQVRVFWCQESPANVRLLPSSARVRFNLTGTYMRGTDISVVYGKTIQLPKSEERNVRSGGAAGKTKLAVVRVSQCLSISKVTTTRMDYLREIGKYMDVDYFGTCFEGRRCPNEVCSDEVLGKKYKFFFAFENSNCEDYITEKFWSTALEHGMVPVVRGSLSREDYTRAAPPNSFIYADDFSGPEELAKRLKNLDKHDEEYNKYLEWTKTHKVAGSNFFGDLCDRLHEMRTPSICKPVGERWGPQFCSFPVPIGSHGWPTRLMYWIQSYNVLP